MKEHTIKPHLDRLLVKVVEAPKYTRGGIALPDTVSKDPVVKAQVLAVGPGKLESDPMIFSVGDMVLLRERSGAEVEHDGDKLLIVTNYDVLGWA